MYKNIHFSKVCIGIILVAFHLAAFIQFRLILFTFDSYYLWTIQFHVLWGFSLLFALIQLPAKNPLLIGFLISMRFIFLMIMNLPLSTHTGLKMTLFTSVLFPTGVSLPYPANTILSVLMILLIMLSQRSGYVFGEQIAAPSLNSLIVIGLQMALISFLSCSVNTNKLRVFRQEQIIKRLNDSLSKISRTNIGFQQYAVKASKKSQVTERKRLSREIHDSVGYVLTNILMMIKTSLLLIPKKCVKVKDLLAKAKAEAEEGIVEIRSALHELRNQKVLRERGLSAIHKLIKTFSEATGVRVATEYGNIPNSFGQKTDLFIYRMIQEGLLNAFTHGEADYIRIHFWKSDGHIQVSLFDNGKGCQDITKGIGLRGMEERIKRLGGTLTLRNDPIGFEIIAIIPERSGQKIFQ